MEDDSQDVGGQGSGQFLGFLSNVLYEFPNPMASFGLASMGTNMVGSHISQWQLLLDQNRLCKVY